MNDIKTSLESIVEYFKIIDDAINHPGANLMNFLAGFFKECLETFALASFDILVVVGFFALVMYVFGWKKGKNISFMCPAIYIIIQILTKVLCK